MEDIQTKNDSVNRTHNYGGRTMRKISAVFTIIAVVILIFAGCVARNGGGRENAKTAEDPALLYGAGGDHADGTPAGLIAASETPSDKDETSAPSTEEPATAEPTEEPATAGSSESEQPLLTEAPLITEPPATEETPVTATLAPEAPETPDPTETPAPTAPAPTEPPEYLDFMNVDSETKAYLISLFHPEDHVTPDILPLWQGMVVSPDHDDLTVMVSLFDYLSKEDYRPSHVKVSLLDPVTKQTVEYAYTNKNGIALITIPRKDYYLFIAIEDPSAETLLQVYYNEYPYLSYGDYYMDPPSHALEDIQARRLRGVTAELSIPVIRKEIIKDMRVVFTDKKSGQPVPELKFQMGSSSYANHNGTVFETGSDGSYTVRMTTDEVEKLSEIIYSLTLSINQRADFRIEGNTIYASYDPMTSVTYTIYFRDEEGNPLKGVIVKTDDHLSFVTDSEGKIVYVSKDINSYNRTFLLEAKLDGYFDKRTAVAYNFAEENVVVMNKKYEYSIDVTVRDENGNPVQDASMSFLSSFFHTDKNGFVHCSVVSNKLPDNYTCTISVDAIGYYGAAFEYDPNVTAYEVVIVKAPEF